MATKKLQKLPDGKLKNFVKAGASNTRVIGKVERHVLAKPTDNSRAFDGMHPSAMVSKYWCHRATYFHLKGNIPAPEPTNFKRELIFAQGHAIHDTWQTWFHEMGTLYGMWRCRDCNNHWMALSPVFCEACGSDNIKYREVPVANEELMITGHADGWLKGFGDDLFLEIKSIGAGTFLWLDKTAWFGADQDFDKAWKNLTAPFESHVSQVQLYMEVMRLSGVTDVPNEAVVLYEAKPNQEIKEFIVRRDAWGVQHIIDGARLVVDSLSKNIAPDCPVGGALKCKQCEGFNE